MKTIILRITLFFLIVQSCSSQKSLLEDIALSKNVTQVLKNATFSVDRGNPFFPEMTIFETKDNSFLQYDNITLTNSAEADVFSKNSISFATEANDSLIKAILIISRNNISSRELLKNMETRFGKGKVLSNGVETSADGKKSGSNNYLWEDTKKSNTYLLSYTYTKINDQPMEEVYVFIFKDSFRHKSMLIATFTN